LVPFRGNTRNASAAGGFRFKALKESLRDRLKAARNSYNADALAFMPEKASTPAARRAVARLTERYFVALKRELADDTEGFWTRVETAVAVKAREEKIDEDK
jgi:hypothetical protein